VIETILETGPNGLMKVQDNTDGDDKTVDLYIASTAPISIPQLPWSYSIDGVKSDTRSFNFVVTTAWQHVSKIYVGYAHSFIFHIDNTGHAELGGPTDLEVVLHSGGTKFVYIKDDFEFTYKKAIPYVNVNGVWTPAVPMVMSNGEWVEVV
jgi:hypothetical protein